MTNQEEWLQLFEETFGRKPSPLEFKAGKDGGFSLSEFEKSSEIKDTNHHSENFSDNANLSNSKPMDGGLFDVTDGGEDDQLVDSKSDTIAVENNAPVFDVSDESYFETTAASEAPQTSLKETSFLTDVAFDASFSNDTQDGVNGLQSAGMTPVSNSQTKFSEIKNKQADWITAFEKFVGRKPGPEEFRQGKANGFDLRTINQFLPRKSPKVVKAVSDKKKYAYIAGGVLAALLLGMYLFGNHYYSRESVAERYLEHLDGKLTDRLDYEVWSDTKKPITKSDISYYESSSNSKPRLVDLIAGTSMTEAGRKWLVFPDWKVAVEPAETTLSTNTKGMTITINGKNWEKSNSDNFSKTIRLYPGDYQFSLSGKLDDQDIETSSKQSLSGKQSVALDIDYLSFSVNSNITDGDLYVGSKKVTSLNNGKAEVSNLAVTKNGKISVQKTFDDSSKLKSETYSIKDIVDGDNITLDADGVLDRDTADQLLTAAYSKLGLYEDDHTTPDGLTDVFQGGTDNSMYKDVVNMVETNTTNAKNRPAESITFEDVDVTSVKQIGAKKYLVEFTVVNSFYYAYDSKFRNSGYYDDKTAWSANVEYVGQDDSSDYSDAYYGDYRITGKASDSKLLNRKDTVD